VRKARLKAFCALRSPTRSFYDDVPGSRYFKNRKETIMIARGIALALAALCLMVPAIGSNAVTSSALADDALPDSQGGRYIFNKQADGIVRLDTQTGEVALCSRKTVGWACEAAPEDRALLENEITRLQAENATLKKDILSRGLPLPSGVMPEPLAQNDAPQNNVPGLHLPSDADIDRMVAYVGQVWHRFVAAVGRAQKQVLNRS
jgi:hypothetical protein